MPWPFDSWTEQDWRAVIQNLVAAAIVFFGADIAARTILGMVLNRWFGSRPRLKVSVGQHPTPLADVDWPFIRVLNLGLSFSPRTRAALNCIVFGTVDESDAEFNWSSSAARPPEVMTIYGDRWADIPLAIRGKHDTNGLIPNYQNLMRARQAYLTERGHLTQGHGAEAGWPLTDGDHRVTVTVQAEDGTKTVGHFVLEVPKWPADMKLRPGR